MEYREGITRCPQHDVDLVEEPPEERLRPLLERIDDLTVTRYTFLAVLGAIAVYAVTGIVLSVIVMFQSTRAWESSVPLYVQYTQRAAWTVALSGLAAIGGAVLVHVYARLRDPGPDPGEGVIGEAGPGDGIMRLLCSLLIVFALVWAASSVATAWERAKFENYVNSGLGGPTAFDEPSQTYLALIALENASWTCGAAALVVMGGILMRRVHARMTRGSAPRSG